MTSKYLIVSYIILVLAVSPCMAGDKGALLPDSVIASTVCVNDDGEAVKCSIESKEALPADAAGNSRLFVVASYGVVKNEEYSGQDCYFKDCAILHYSGNKVTSVEPVVSMPTQGCSYGAAGGGEDCSLGDNSITYEVFGSSAWKWKETTTWGIDPSLHKIQKEINNAYNLFTNSENIVIDERGIKKVN